MSSFNFSNNSNTNNTSTSNPFGTVGSAWMNDFSSSSNNGGMVFQSGTGKGNQSAGQRINSAPTKLTNNNNQKKANWGEILGKKKHSNKRKFGTTNHKRSMSLNLSILDNDMSGLQVLSPKSKPRNNANNNNGIVKPFALNGSSNSKSNNDNNANKSDDIMNGNINTPKHKRSKSDNSVVITANPSFAMGKNPNLINKFMSNRSASALGKLRGSYKCGKCGVPKKGHVCPHEQPKQTQDAQTQCSFDINPNVESSQIRRLVQKLQEKGIISLSGSNDALHALLENVDIPVAQYHQQVVKSATPVQVQVVQQAATRSTSSLSPTNATKAKKTRKKKSNETKKNTTTSKNKNSNAAAKSKKATSSKKAVNNKNNNGNNSKIKKTRKKRSPKAKLIKSNNAALPKRVNSLRTFDSIDSTSSEDPFHMDMDPTDAFDYSEFDLANDELTDDKWFGGDLVDDTNYDDAEMSAMLSA